MPNYVPIRPALHIHIQFRKNFPVYGTIFEKPHEKSQGKNFESLILPLPKTNLKGPILEGFILILNFKPYVIGASVQCHETPCKKMLTPQKCFLTPQKKFLDPRKKFSTPKKIHFFY